MVAPQPLWSEAVTTYTCDDQDRTLLNHYHCERCDVEWEDAWICACDDECPVCGDDLSPYESTEIDQ